MFDPRLIFDVFTFLASCCVGVWVFFMQRNKANAKDIHRLDVRLSKAETNIENMPTHKDIKDVHQRIDEVSTKLGDVNGKLDSIASTTKMINDFLLNGGKK